MQKVVDGRLHITLDGRTSLLTLDALQARLDAAAALQQDGARFAELD